jgi:hypothetical protein
MILVQKGFIILSVDDDRGIIKAQRKKSFFQKSERLAIKALKLDNFMVRVDCWMNTSKSSHELKMREENLLHAIYGYF